MRVFIAVEFTDEMKSYLKRVQESVMKASESGKFTDKDNFHLTLKFIGDVSESDILKIKNCIDQAVSKERTFKLKLNALGEFPRGNKSIVWLGIEDSERLKEIYIKLERSLETVGIKKEDRKFSPHITLGRQVSLNSEFHELQKSIIVDDIGMTVEKISLMESTRVDEKLKYLPIYTKVF